MALQTFCRRCSNVISKFDGSLASFIVLRNDCHYTTGAKEDVFDGGQIQKERPLITSRQPKFPVTYGNTCQAWLESIDTLEGKKLGMIDLHPDVFATYPRLDILYKNVQWQKEYRFIDYRWEPSRAEMPGGKKKPWPQKGMGKARHGSIRSPIWKNGGQAHGPRGPENHFYMLSASERALGLRVALSCKYAQNDLKIVDSLDLPTSEPEFLSDLADVRFWGYSVLFVDDTDETPTNAALATKQINGFSLMPAYGLNVFSMLKHDTLVLTLAALERIERKLLEQLHSTSRTEKYVNSLTPEDFQSQLKKDYTMYTQFNNPIDLNRDFQDHPKFNVDIEEE